VSEFAKCLNRIGVRSPCNADWEEMQGNDQIRFCKHCNLSVHNLSAMTKEKVLQLVAASEGRLCVRFHRLPDGSIKTTDNPGLGLQVSRKVSRIAAGAFTAAMALSTAAGTYAQNAPQRNSQTQAPDLNKAEDSARQADFGVLTGVVDDVNGAVITGASLTLTNKETGQIITSNTGENGEFNLNLGAGNYVLHLTSPGFKIATLPNIDIAKGLEKRINVTIEVGSLMGDVVMIANPQIGSPVGKMGETLVPPHQPNLGISQTQDNLSARSGYRSNGAVVIPQAGSLKLVLLDTNGAVIGGASVILTKSTDQKIESRTNSDGMLDLKPLAVGRYILELKSPGFDRVILQDVLIEPGAGTVLAITMQVGVGTMGVLALASDIIPMLPNAIEDPSAHINDVDKRTGLTPLAKALSNNDVDEIKRLLAAGADVGVRIHDGRTVLMTINERTKIEAIRELLSAKPDLSSKDLNLQTSLMIASKIGRDDIVEAFIDSPGKSKDINTSDYLGNTALIYAVASKKFNTVKILTAAGADLNIRNVYGVTALDYAQGNDDKEMMEFLKAHGAIQ